jgi:hypothetical protein
MEMGGETDRIVGVRFFLRNRYVPGKSGYVVRKFLGVASDSYVDSPGTLLDICHQVEQWNLYVRPVSVSVPSYYPP